MANPALHLSLHVHRDALHMNIDLRLHAPWTIVFGPSGSGKTSVLRAIAGFLHGEHCAVALNGTDLSKTPPHRRGMALVQQRSTLFPHMTAWENVLFSLQRTSLFKDRPHAEVEEAALWMEHFGVAHTRNRKPRAMSGGEQHRVEIVRAIMSKPKLLMLDEAFNGTDSALRSSLLARLKEWQQQSQAIILSVTHNVAEAYSAADEVVLLRDGRVIAQGVPAEVLLEERLHLQHTLGY